jgi:Big-like domain-containing protein
MARLKNKMSDGTPDLLDPTDDLDPTVLQSSALAAISPPPTLPPQALERAQAPEHVQALELAADPAQPHLPTEIPPVFTAEAQMSATDALLPLVPQLTSALTSLNEFCPRQIIFTIPGQPGVQVTATENDGKIDFIVDVLDDPKSTGDLRGLFFHFNESKLATLQVTGSDVPNWITGTQINANHVIDLLDGVNMSGAASPFDVGIRFGTPGTKKDDIFFPVHFTLSDATNDLTLDDFAHLEFGARLNNIGGPGGPRGGVSKITGIAPAAPDAKDDMKSLFEDGASGLNDPSKSPTAVLFNVLENDNKGDGNTLTVVDFHEGPLHGTVTVAPNGDVLYTPNLDYSGTDSFEYCVSDGQGGQDSATVNVTVEAVADKPTI